MRQTLSQNFPKYVEDVEPPSEVGMVNNNITKLYNEKIFIS
jgi:hypothetical protein